MTQFEELTQQAIEGNESPLKAFIELKKEIDRLTALQESIKSAAIQEAANEPEPFDRYGAKITYLSSAGSRWDFSNLEDWKAKKKELEEIEAKHKAAYQAWQRGGIFADEETGEKIEPAAYKNGNPTIQIRIK